MNRDDITTKGLAPERCPTTIDYEIQQLLDVLDEVESELCELTEYLQEGRKHIVAFEMGKLALTVQRREALFSHISTANEERHLAIEQVWARNAPESHPRPEEIPAALRELARLGTHRGDELIERATRLEILFNVTQEIQHQNRNLVHRALSWTDTYLAEVTGFNRTKTYDSTGRIRDQLTKRQRSLI